MGAWIEILLPTNIAPTGDVAPLVGAWIEIEYSSISEATREKSLLSWERGLKYPVTLFCDYQAGRSSRGSVD